MGRHSPERSMVRAILGLHAATGVTIGIACGAWIDGAKPGRAADAPFVEERSFVSDIRTMYECIERMARDNGLTVVYTGGGGTWKSQSWKVETKERLAIVAERQKLPFLGDGRTSYILLIGSHTDRGQVPQHPERSTATTS